MKDYKLSKRKEKRKKKFIFRKNLQKKKAKITETQ